MSLYNISISHKTAPVEFRELLAFTREEKISFLKEAVSLEGVQECVLITTCNRTEVYVWGEEPAQDAIMNLLAEKKNLQLNKILKHILRYQEDKAVRHLFLVACGLDSMVIGEDEILRQVKDDYLLSLDHNTTDYVLNTLFRFAITCAKKVKTETRLSKTPVSIGTLVANQVFHFPKSGTVKVLIIGLTGKFGTIIMKNLYHNRQVTITGTIRIHNLADELVLSYPEVKMIDYGERYDWINEMDIIISATTSPHYTITCEELKKHLKEDKPRLFIDLAVPMDIDKEISQLNQVELIDIDYYKQISETNNTLKLKEMDSADVIINQVMDEFYKEIHFRNFLPYLDKVKALFEKQSFESVIYQIKNKSSEQELRSVLTSFMNLVTTEAER